MSMVIFYHFYTPLHFGSGSTLSYVDLPIERESHTNYPVMPSSGIKGVFRAQHQAKNGESNTEKIFGKGDEEGKIIFTDGRVLFFPVKSARGVFVWITCPLVLKRFERDIKLIDSNFTFDFLERNRFDNDEQVFVSSDKVTVNGKLILEELSFEKKGDNVSIAIDKFGLNDVDKDRIAVVSDDMFSYFVKNHTEINARIRIDQLKGTVQEGALWYEELVPAETVFYSIVIARIATDKESLIEFSSFVSENGNIFQFGGDETLGRGFAKVSAYERR